VGLSDLATEIELRHGGDKIVLVREEDVWRISTPIATAADPGEVSSILSELEFLKAKTILRAENGKPLDMKSYGLDEPERSVTFKAAGRTWTLNIGDLSADGKSVYVARADATEPTAYVVAKTLLDKASKTVNQLRDKTPIRFRTARVTRLKIALAEKPTLECRKEKDGWRVASPVADEADPEAMRKILDDIASLRIASEDFLTEDDTRLAEFGLDQPRMKVTVFEGDASRTLLVGGEVEGRPGKFYAKREGENSIFALKKDDLDKLRKTLADLRSRTALRFDAMDATGVEVALPGGTVRLVKSGDEWKMEEPEGRTPDSSQVMNFLNALRDLQVKDWIDTVTDETLAKSGIAEPQATVTVTLREKDRPPRVLRFGKRADKPGLCHARRGDSGPILLVSSEVLTTVLSGHLAFLPRKVLEFRRSDAVALRVERPDIAYALKKEDDTWKVLEPVETAADAMAVDDLLWDLCYLEAKRLVAEKPESLDLYGLDRPRIRAAVTVKRQEEQAGSEAKKKPTSQEAAEEKVLLVGKAAEDDMAYAMVEGGDYVFLLGKVVLDRLNAEFVSRQVCSFDKDAVMAVEAAGPDGSVVFRYEKSGDQWKRMQPAEGPIKKEAVEKVLDEIRGLRAESIAEYRKDAADLKRYGLDRPERTVRVERSGAEPIILTIGAKEKETRYLVSSSPCIFRVKEEDLTAILATPSQEGEQNQKSD